MSIVDAINNSAIHLEDKYKFTQKFLDKLKQPKIIMMGEATHGTHEFYKARIELTKQLILDENLTAIMIEGDWPAAYKVNKYIQNLSEDKTAFDSLDLFTQFPMWMWRNKDILEFIEWLRNHNSKKPALEKVGFYGLDLYSLHASIHAVIEYLEKVDPQEANAAKQRYACFDKFGYDMQKYGYIVSNNLSLDCRREIIEQLVNLQNNAIKYLNDNGLVREDELFSAEQNATVVKDAESYYKSLFAGNSNTSWNIRDTHMVKTLEALYKHQSSQNRNPKIAVWAHNSHIGDANATQFGVQGQINIGQLAREYFGDNNVFLLGFSTYHGSVSAASGWNQPVERKTVRKAIPESYEEAFHEADLNDFLILMDQFEDIKNPLLQRAIGVIYAPATERYSHYFYADIKNQFDAIIHYDKTNALEPLEKTALWEEGEFPETYPSGI